MGGYDSTCGGGSSGFEGFSSGGGGMHGFDGGIDLSDLLGGMGGNSGELCFQAHSLSDF